MRNFKLALVFAVLAGFSGPPASGSGEGATGNFDGRQDEPGSMSEKTGGNGLVRSIPESDASAATPGRAANGATAPNASVESNRADLAPPKGDPARAAARPGLRLSFTDWYVPGLRGSADAAFSFVARTGLQGVEVNPEYDGNSPKLLNSPLLRQQYFDAEKSYGLQISSFCLGELWVDKLATDASSVDKIRGLIEVCRLMDVHVILLPIFADYRGAGVTDTIVERLKLVTPAAEAAGVVLGVENYETAETNAALLARVNSPAFRIYYDIGNSSERNYDIYGEIRMLGNRICQFHVKDQQTSAGLPGRGKIDFARFRAALEDINYHGWLVLELTAGEPNYKSSAEYLKTVFAVRP